MQDSWESVVRSRNEHDVLQGPGAHASSGLGRAWKRRGWLEMVPDVKVTVMCHSVPLLLVLGFLLKLGLPKGKRMA